MNDTGDKQLILVNSRIQKIIQWVARVVSVFVILISLYLAFYLAWALFVQAASGYLPSGAALNGLVFILSQLFLAIGLIIAWKKELLGASISLISLLFLDFNTIYTIYYTNLYYLHINPVSFPIIPVISLPVWLFYLSWFMQWRKSRSASMVDLCWLSAILGVLPNVFVGLQLFTGVLENKPYMMTVWKPIAIWWGINLGILIGLILLRNKITKKPLYIFTSSFIGILIIGSFLVVSSHKNQYKIPTKDEQCIVLVDSYLIAREMTKVDQQDNKAGIRNFHTQLNYALTNAGNHHELKNNTYQFIDNLQPVLEEMNDIQNIIFQLKGKEIIGDKAEEFNTSLKALESSLLNLVNENCDEPTVEEKCSAIVELKTAAEKGKTIKTYWQAVLFHKSMQQTIQSNYRVFHFIDPIDPILMNIKQIESVVQSLNKEDPAGEKAVDLHSLIIDLNVLVRPLVDEYCLNP